MDFGFLKKIILGDNEPCLGIDIGTTSIKMVELARKDNQTMLTNYGVVDTFGYLERVNTALQASTLKLFEEEVAGYVRLLLRETKTQTRTAVASLPSFAVFSTILDIPPMPEKEIAQALQFKARQYIPLPISAVSLDWVRVSEGRVLLLAIPNELIEKHKTIFKEAGLILKALEVEGISLARVLSAGASAQADMAADDTALVIDIGSRSTALSIIAGGTLLLMGQTDFAGASLSHGIASALGIATRRAEDLKKQRGIVNLGFGADQELSTLLLPLIDVILEEARRLRERYQTTYEKDIKRVILSGGGAHMPGLVDYVGRRFELPTTHAQPFSAIHYPTRAEAALAPLGPTLAVAVGAALRGVAS